MTYLALKLVHILAAIVALGLTTSFGMIAASTAGNATALPVSLRLIARMEKVSSAAFGVLLLTGLVLGYVLQIPWTMLWFSGSLALSLVALVLANTVQRPGLKAQLALLERAPLPMNELAKIGGRMKKTGMVLTLISLTITGMMVFKPML